MRIQNLDQLKKIAAEIVSEGKTDEQWALIESDDMFQEENFVGGYDATESAFCFSYYDEQRREFWFQLTLEDVEKIAKGENLPIEARDAD